MYNVKINRNKTIRCNKKKKKKPRQERNKCKSKWRENKTGKKH